MHLLSNGHVSPPSHSDTLIKQYSREDTVRSDHIEFLNRLVGDGGNASIGNVSNHVASSWISDVIDGSKHARDFGANRVASANTLSVLENAALDCVCQCLLQAEVRYTQNPNSPNDVDIIVGHLQDLPGLMTGEPISYIMQS